MNIMLDTKYFQYIYTDEINNTKYNVIKPLKNPMILFSKTNNIPLASLHFISPTAKTCISKRTDSTNADFQCLIDKSNEEVQFVVTNLTEYMLNFNIIKTNLLNLNKVNCLKKHQSYEIKSDQENSCKMILKQIIDESNKEIKVCEENRLSNKNGNIYYLNVVPENNKLVSDLFKDTYWDCVDYFLLQEEKVGHNKRTLLNTYSNNTRRLNNVFTNFGYDIKRDIYTPFEGNRVGSESNYDLLIGHNRFDGAIDNKVYISDNQNNNMNNESDGIPDLEETDIFLDNKMEHLINISRPLGITTVGSNNKISSYNIRETIPNPIFKISPWATWIGPELNPIQSNTIPLKNNQEIINQSKLGKIHMGEKTIEDKSIECSIKFNFDSPSKPCKICLSINGTLIFKENMTSEELLVESKDFFKNVLNGRSKILLGNIEKIYKSDCCAICMDDDNVNNLVFYQCGHQCCHHECGKDLKKCPLCRKNIDAYIKL